MSLAGHKSNDMLARLEADVLSKNPQWMTLSCGVNDVWHGNKGVPLDDAQAAAQAYEKRSAKRTGQGNLRKRTSRKSSNGRKPRG